MSFIKHGDGKIVSVLDEEELTEEQKEAVLKSKQAIKQSEKTDTSTVKESGR